MKFQAGDRVVYVNGQKYDDVFIYKHGTVIRRQCSDQGVIVKFDNEPWEIDWLYDRRFVLEEIYESPLYKALKEEE